MPEVEQTLCHTCSALNLHELFKQGTSAALLWKIPNFGLPTCSLCSLISWIVGQTISNDNGKTVNVLGRTRRVDKTQFALSFQIVDGNSGAGSIDCPHIVLPLASGYKSLERGYTVLARPTRNTSFDPALVKEWLSTCDGKHGFDCSMGSRIKASTAKFRLIDVERHCVVHAPSQCRYTALSYVWGAVQQPVLTSEVLTAWEVPGALLSINMPQTIRDAMQNVAEEVTQQVAHMDFIYRRAYLTIIVADGDDCNSGIPSVQPREAIQRTLTVGDLSIGTVFLSVKNELLRSKWASRAWTLQEYALSFRSLIFTRRQIFFGCAEGLCREDVVGYLVNGLPRNERYLLPIALDFYLANRLPENVLTNVYTSLVSTFSIRRITYSGDALKAFTGIIGALQPHLGDFWWGLPERYLGYSMCWSSENHLQRRPGFPSWSWVGWQPVDGEETPAGLFYPDSRYAGYHLIIANPRHTFASGWRHGAKFAVKDDDISASKSASHYLNLPGPEPTHTGYDGLGVGFINVDVNTYELCIASCRATLNIHDYPRMTLNLQVNLSEPLVASHPIKTRFLLSSKPDERPSKLQESFHRRAKAPMQPDVIQPSTSHSPSLPQITVASRPVLNVDFILLLIYETEVVILPVKWDGHFAERIGNPQFMKAADWFQEKVVSCKFYLR